jgi:formylglycine-generating enzyme required for sulfatase activity
MPIVEASWLGACNYCASIGKRLPTEAEWEFAARGPEGRLYLWENSLSNKTRRHLNRSWGNMALSSMGIQMGQRLRVFWTWLEIYMSGRLVNQSPTLTGQMTGART